MGGGVSVPAEMKLKIHTFFDIKTSEEWQRAEELKTIEDLRAELARLRQACVALACVNAKHDNKRVKVALDFSRQNKATNPKVDESVHLLKSAMESNFLFQRCKAEDVEELVTYFHGVEFSTGDTIIKQGDSGDAFYVIETGTCEVYIHGSSKPVATPSAGESFGDLALMYDTPRAATIIAKTAVKAWRIERNDYRLVLATNAIARSNKYKELLSQVVLKSEETEKLLRDCVTDTQLSKLADAMDEDNVQAGVDIIREGDEGQTFYVITEGTVVVSTKKEGIVATLSAGGYFGDRALVADETRAATCTAGDQGAKVLALDREDFIALLGSIEELITEGSNAENTVDSGVRIAEKIGLADLDIKQTLGHGAFGKVQLVHCQKTNEHYALKSQAKIAIVENSLQDHVLMERHILMQLDHPFILKLFSAFQDDYNIYFLLELLQGGELFTHLRSAGRFNEATMKFYVAGVVLAFEHMHARWIAYRDLKPENLVLDKSGYVKIVDLGLAKRVTAKTWTLCGTPDYLSPEVILNEGHDKAVDYWALGVLMYELVSGTPPFYADDPMEVYEKILSGSVSFPPHLSKYLSDIIRKLLKLCQSKRLGNGKKGIKAIEKHRFFAGFAWDDLLEKRADKLRPPIQISISDDGDASNFAPHDDKADRRVTCPDWNPKLDD